MDRLANLDARRHQVSVVLFTAPSVAWPASAMEIKRWHVCLNVDWNAYSLLSEGQSQYVCISS
jgi:hypothetical protein